jgi:formate dehydrogenase major subunit
MISLSPADLLNSGFQENDMISLISRRGSITAQVKSDEGLQEGNVFMPFCYAEAAVNLLTISAIDPIGKIPEFKHCAVRIEKPPTLS